MSLIKVNNDFTESFDSLTIEANARNNGKPKRKNSEKRKEKSRKAARERRSQESKIFDQIEAILPIPVKTINHLDKASLVRLGINFLKIRQVIEPIKSLSSSKYIDYENEPLFEEFSAIKALNGFMLVLSKEGDMVYLSENVEKYLGLTQIDLIGQSIYDFSHPCDHNDIKDILALKNIHSSNPDLSLINDNHVPSSFSLRMKCTLTNKGRNLNLKSASYKVIHFSGHLLNISDPNIGSSDAPLTQSSRYFMVSVGEPIEHPYGIEKPLNLDIFVSRHSPDMKYTQVDDRIQKILGYSQKELMGKSMFNFFHALDLPELEKFFKTLFSRGQSQSGYYRFLAKSGGHSWLLTQATLITDSHSSQPQSVVCVNHVISGIENRHQILSEEQCFEEDVQTIQQIEVEKIFAEQLPEPPQHSYVSSTKTVFAPKTADMESGFLVFTDDDNGMTILSDPEDLTHLAPEAGDVCVPMPGLLGIDFNELDFFEEVFLNQNGCNPNFFSDDDKLKLNDENLQFNCNTDIQDSSTDDVFKDKDESEGFIGKLNDNALYTNRSVTQNIIKNYPAFRDNQSVEDSPLPNDPFLSYHEEIFSSSPSTDSSDPYSSKSNSPINISSPILSQTSNYFCKTPECEEVSKLNISDTTDLIDDKVLEMRAPFCPIDEDFPLLLNDDLQMPYSSTNIDELINFETLSKPLNSSEPAKKSSLIFDNGLIGQQSGCLETLLQSNDSSLKSKNFNLNQTAKQNIDNSGIKINISNINSNLMKCDNSISINKLQLVYNNTNQTQNARRTGSIGKNQTNEYLIKINGVNGPQFMINSTKASKTAVNEKPVSTERIIIKKNDFAKPFNTNKRPYSSEPPDILYSICPNDILSNQRSKGLSKDSQNQKRIKVNNLDANNQGNSVLMNLLVNGEDVTNGYSKYSNIDRVNQSSNFNINDNIYQKLSNNRKNSKLLLFDGHDIR